MVKVALTRRGTLVARERTVGRPKPKKKYKLNPRRVSRADRLRLMAAHGITHPTGRQWRKLRQRLRREERPNVGASA